ncbi:hypothetical protein CEXT_546371 [Caerostris extrusa]|uniref:Uncharacterized protein n=1 Tax=Caerostris extrusa TaxID=172846 RepID=A0AAV4YA82_CAEEX|nr:hypothetical protein CEXT_546371 [Caerostris extrusa]
MSVNDFFDRVTNAMEVSSEVNEPAEVHLDLTLPSNADANASTTVTPEGMCRQLVAANKELTSWPPLRTQTCHRTISK